MAAARLPLVVRAAGWSRSPSRRAHWRDARGGARAGDLRRRGKVAVTGDGRARNPLFGIVALALALAGCRSHASVGAGVEMAARGSAPADDVGEPCADVSDLRACWGAPGGPLLVARALPSFPAPTAMGFRCSGSGATRTCEPREASAGAFACALAT